MTDDSYKFPVSLSLESYVDKKICNAMIGSTKKRENREIRKEYGFKANRGIGFIQQEVTCHSLLDSLLQGKVFCHLFNPKIKRKDGSFGSSQKKNENYCGSYVIGIDIDKTKYTSAKEFVDKLSLKPSFYYSSYSNMGYEEDGSSKGARFRLIYVFSDLIANQYYFKFCATLLNRIIQSDTGEEIKDDCNVRCSQYFNGTNINDTNFTVEFGITNNIYSLSDIGVTEDRYIRFLENYAEYESIDNKHIGNILNILRSITKYDYIFDKKELKYYKNTTINDETEKRFNSQPKQEINFDVKCDIDPETLRYALFPRYINYILYDWDKLDQEEFKKSSEWIEARRNTKYIYRIEKDWIENRYQIVTDEYFSLIYYPVKVADGDKRRKKLFQRMCLRRVINPDITKDELVINTIIDILKFFDNSDNVLDSNFIRDNVIEAYYGLTHDEILEHNNDTIEYLKKITRPKKGLIYRNKNEHTCETKYHLIDNIYNPSLSVKENLLVINKIISVKKTVIYDYLKTRKPNLKENQEKMIFDFIDPQLTIRKNREILKDKNIKCSDEKLRELLKRKKPHLNLDAGKVNPI